MPLSLIVAYKSRDANSELGLEPAHIIGERGAIPWRLSADLKRFKQLTMGHHLIMGRKTFESLGRVLPGRTSIVLSRQQDLQLPNGVLLAHTIDEALKLCANDPEPFVIGGAEIYRLAFPYVTKTYETHVYLDRPIQGDAFFPEEYDERRLGLEPGTWRCIQSEEHPADEKNECASDFVVYELQR